MVDILTAFLPLWSCPFCNASQGWAQVAPLYHVILAQATGDWTKDGHLIQEDPNSQLGRPIRLSLPGIMMRG